MGTWMKAGGVCGLLMSAAFGALAEPPRSHADKPERPTFSSLDVDGDGKMTLEEFSQHTIPHGKHERVFTHIDADADGVISKTEFDDHKPKRPPKNRDYQPRP
ncbi:EF-hand domain-containing protein [Echinimonas agarilytica]|uniref:EF-hand domain-containing protein n=1 Tax=Echinimonas agarilytica TaxID=1215918 RepID=A0AA41W463_9GAMM|nr:EF-hand domain-containing protein [Echinimonas agarilytica]MCM2678529.1 EF-hand domain-containing protein [Echinimonas agarilytica]